jgi:hypothetical protein
VLFGFLPSKLDCGDHRKRGLELSYPSPHKWSTQRRACVHALCSLTFSEIPRLVIELRAESSPLLPVPLLVSAAAIGLHALHYDLLQL